MNPRCNLTPEEQKIVLGRFHGQVTIEMEEKIREMLPQYLFFKMEYDENIWGEQMPGKYRLCTCSACGDSFEGVRINGARGKVHNEKVTCPNCGRTVTGKAVYKFKYDMPSLYRWVKTAFAWPDGKGGILIEAGDAANYFNHDELHGCIRWVPIARYYFAPGKLQKWKNIRGYGERVEWRAEKTVTEPFMPNVFSYYDGEYAVHDLLMAVDQSGLKYCQIGPFMEYAYHATEGESARYQMKFLAWAALYPQIEMAVKWEMYQAVWELITEGKKNSSIIRWSGKTPEQFLRMSRNEAKLFLRSGMDFQDLKTWKENTNGMTFTEYADLMSGFGSREIQDLQACALLSGTDISAAAKYIHSLLPICPGMATRTPGQIVRIWKDYLEMAGRLHYDLNVKSVRMPKNLEERHDLAAAAVKIEENRDEIERYRKRLKALKKRYAFRFGGLQIVVPESSEEIIREGKTLCHCVGGYAARHIEGMTTILFLRKERTPNRSFLTIEVEEDKVTRKVSIRQIHGYRNEGYAKNAVPPKVKYAWFLQAWLDQVNGKQKERKTA